MRTWDDYKNYVKGLSDENKKDMETIETTAAIISAIIKQRNELGISQRELAALCDMPQSSIARMETLKTVPNLETVVKVMLKLGLKLAVVTV